MDKLHEFRKKIDTLDTQLLILLNNRLAIVREVGKFKKEKGLAPLDAARWNQVLEKGLAQAESLGLKRDFVKKILDTIHEEALQIESTI